MYPQLCSDSTDYSTCKVVVGLCRDWPPSETSEEKLESKVAALDDGVVEAPNNGDRRSTNQLFDENILYMYVYTH